MGPGEGEIGTGVTDEPRTRSAGIMNLRKHVHISV